MSSLATTQALERSSDPEAPRISTEDFQFTVEAKGSIEIMWGFYVGLCTGCMFKDIIPTNGELKAKTMKKITETGFILLILHIGVMGYLK